MKLNFITALLVLIGQSFLFAQSIPFNTEQWDINARGHIIEAHEGAASIYIKNGIAKLKEVSFQNGIIEFDVFMKERRSFSGILFRMEDSNNYEEIYLRGHLNGQPDAMQYTPVNNGATAWQLYHDQGQAILDGKIGWGVKSVGGYNALYTYPNNRWFHVKLVLSGTRADLYLDNEEKPVLQMRELKRGLTNGGIALRSSRGGVHFANFSYQATDDVTLTDLPAPSENTFEGELITTWQVSNTFNEKELAGIYNLETSFLNEKQWQVAKTEKTGLLNISTLHKGSREKNTVFTKINIQSDKDQLKQLDFGYSDRVKVFCNNQLMYSGDNGYRTRDYRFLGTIGYFDSVYLPLKRGDNEVIIALSESFGGWGIQGKLENGEGFELVEKE